MANENLLTEQVIIIDSDYTHTEPNAFEFRFRQLTDGSEWEFNGIRIDNKLPYYAQNFIPLKSHPTVTIRKLTPGPARAQLIIIKTQKYSNVVITTL